MNPELQERLEILRRIAERGKKLSEKAIEEDSSIWEQLGHLDLWIHMLDEIKRIK